MRGDWEAARVNVARWSAKALRDCPCALALRANSSTDLTRFACSVQACASLRTRAADEKREIGCSELYSMVSAIEQQTDTQPASTAPQAQAATPSASTAGPAQPSASSSAPGTSQQPGKAAPQQPGGAAYYKGLLASDLKQDNGASSADMLKRSLGLAGEHKGVKTLPCTHRHCCSAHAYPCKLHTMHIYMHALLLVNWSTSIAEDRWCVYACVWRVCAGFVSGLLVALVVAFLASNGLLG